MYIGEHEMFQLYTESALIVTITGLRFNNEHLLL